VDVREGDAPGEEVEEGEGGASVARFGSSSKSFEGFASAEMR